MSAAERLKSARIRLLFQKCLLALGGAVVGLALCEALLRLAVCFHAASIRPMLAGTVSSTVIERTDEVRNHALIEGVQFIATGNPPGLEFCAYGEVSQQGMNDDPVPLEKAPGEFRILILGDSFVEARQVKRKENFCKLLERGLKLHHERPIRVINSGVSSYSPLLCYLYFKGELAKYHPDVVVFAFFANDVFDDMRYTHAAVIGANGIPVAVRPGAPWPVLRRETNKEPPTQGQEAMREALDPKESWWSAHFYLAALVRQFAASRELKKAFADPPKNDEFFILESDPELKPVQDHGWRLTQKYIGLLKAACDEAHARFALTCVPLGSQITGHSSYDHFFFSGRPTDANEVNIKRIAAELNVPYTDLFSPLRKAGDGLYFPNDGHWTPKAHRVVAESLQRTLSPMLDK